MVRHLIWRGQLISATEEAVVIGSSDPVGQARMMAGLRQAGLIVTAITPEAAASVDGVEGVPPLKIDAPDGLTAFRGGYRDQGAPPDQFPDESILSGLMASRPIHRPRVYGCATSNRLRSALDPLSLKSLSIP